MRATPCATPGPDDVTSGTLIGTDPRRKIQHPRDDNTHQQSYD
jgi:hypothetical protein